MAIYNNRVCKNCGAVFSGGPRAWYCPNCRLERQRERGRYYSRHGYSRHIGGIDVCENCGKEYFVESGLQKYCKECQDEMHRQVDNRQGTEYYHKMDAAALEERKTQRRELYTKRKDEINTARRALRPDKSCIHCGAPIRRGKYCEGCRRGIVEMYNSGRSTNEIVAEYKCSKNSIYILCKKASEENSK